MGFDSTFKKFWERGKKVDPLTHGALELIVKQDSKNVSRMARTDAKLLGGEDTWLGRRANDLGDEADKNVADPVRGVGRAAATAGIVYGGMAMAGAGAGGAGAATGAAEGAAAGAGGAGTAAGAAGGGISFGGAASGTGVGFGAGGSTVGAGMGAAGGTGITFGAAGAAPVGLTAGEVAGVAGGSGMSSASFASGIGSKIPEGSAISGSYSAGNGFDWQRWARMQGTGAGQQQQQRPLDQDEVHFDAEGRPYIASSRKLKRPSGTPTAEVVARGVAGANPIDANGMQIVAIQALNRRLQALRQRINEFEKKRAAR